jgi:hypothetical protein
LLINSAETSATARAERSSAMALPAANAATRACRAKLLTARVAAAGLARALGEPV